MLNESSTKKEIESRFANAKKVMDDLCIAYYGMTWDEHERLHAARKGGMSGEAKNAGTFGSSDGR